MAFFPFELERWQSTWENRVRYNLSESGVHPLSVGELLDLAGAKVDPLKAVRLGYSQSNGTDLLRERIAALYPGATPDNVLVTTGSSEANFVACWRLIAPGDKVTVQAPNYLQTNGLARNFGAQVREYRLREELGWEPDPSDIASEIVAGTKLVVVTNPHNPSGHVLSDAARKAIVNRCAAVGAWLLADEVYTGAERDGNTTPSFWGTYDKLIIVNGLSKAYGLPGLRIGWIVTTPQLAAETWERHDYTTIGPSGASDYLATVALDAAVRPRIIARTRKILNANYPTLETWLKTFGGAVGWRPPRAGAICFVRHNFRMPGQELVELVRAEQDVLLVPGEQFGLAGYIRFGFGNTQEELDEALARVAEVLRPLLGD